MHTTTDCSTTHDRSRKDLKSTMEGAYKSNEMLTQALVMLCQKALAQCDKRVGEDSIFCTGWQTKNLKTTSEVVTLDVGVLGYISA